MKTILKVFGAALASFLLTLPFMIMELVNRRQYHEGFPFFLFFVMWFNLFAVCLILLPLLPLRRSGGPAETPPAPERKDTRLSNPRSALLLSLGLLLALAIPLLLDLLGWVPVQALLNGPDAEQAYLPGMIINFGLSLLPLAAGIIACLPIGRTLRAGGSLLAHPLHLLIVVFLLVTYAVGLGSLILDQWPCFSGQPVCD